MILGELSNWLQIKMAKMSAQGISDICCPIDECHIYIYIYAYSANLLFTDLADLSTRP